MKLILCLLCVCAAFAEPLSVEVVARSALLMNADTGSILFEKEGYTPTYPASTTKIATALYLLESKRLGLTQVVSASREALRMRGNGPDAPHLLEADGSSMGLVVGERMKVEDLFHGMMLVSGNDAANVLSEVASGSIPRFVEELNAYLKSIGCKNTQFMNPHGYHHPDHWTTAYDLALMAQRGLKFSTFRDIVGKSSFTRPKTNKKPAAELAQTNALLRRGKHHYPKAIGIKTGGHEAAGNCLVAAAEHEGRTLIAVVLGCEKNADRFADARRLFEAAFQEEKVEHSVIGAKTRYTKPLDGGKSPLQGVLLQDVKVAFFPAEEPTLKAFLHWDALQLPVRKGQRVGEVRAVDERGVVVASGVLTAESEVQPTFWFGVKQWWKGLWK